MIEVILSQPKFHVVDGPKFDLGDVPNFAPTKHQLKIKNMGTDTLILSSVDASCGCTTVILADNHLLPNDSTDLFMTFDAKRFSGQVQKSISMVTNDSLNRFVDLLFTANVISVLELNPEYLFLRTAKDSTANQNLVIKNITSEEIIVSSISSTSDLLTAKLSKESMKPNEEVTLNAVFKPNSPGIVNGNIDLKTNHKKFPLMTIRFVGWAR